MSLTAEQRAQTAQDFSDNLERASLTPDELADWLKLDRHDLDGVLSMTDGTNPATVWLVRDAIESVLEGEGDAGDWSTLTGEARQQAQEWFALGEVPTR